MKEEIVEAIDSPRRLEELYRDNPKAFASAFADAFAGTLIVARVCALVTGTLFDRPFDGSWVGWTLDQSTSQCLFFRFSMFAALASTCAVPYHTRMERVVHKAKSFKDADKWDRRQHWAMSPQERIRVVRTLQKRVYPLSRDVRACHETN